MPPPPTSKVELKVRCKNLINKDLTSYSDPQVFLFVEEKPGQWSKSPYATTERIKDSLNPVFVKGLQIDYRFETVQRLKFLVYDIDDKHSNKFSDQDFQGEVICELGSIIGAPGGQLALHLTHPKVKHSGNLGLGMIIIRAEELSISKRVLNFAIRANDLTKKGLFKSAPSAFIVIQRANENGTFSPVYKSPVVLSHDDPVWEPFSIKEVILCNGDPNRPLKIEVMSHKSTGTHTVIGTTAIFTAAELSRCSFPHRMAIPPMTGSSVLTIQQFSVTQPPSFMDFLAGGGSLGLCVAIDFTQSNGDPKSPQSLHYKNSTGENEYTRAIRSVGNILQCYDSDKRIPVYGFGARVGGQVSHAFPLNGNPSNPEVDGVDGILAAYWHALTFVELYGPTNFAPVITYATEIAKQSEKHVGGYTVLLILTDGAITDMNDTIGAIRKATRHPMSIIIVGIGRAQFTNMNILDGDDEDRTAFKKSRDIVQFVAARDYLPHREYGLASALLAELPDQFVEYMTVNKITPRPPIRVDTMGVPIGAAPVAMSVPQPQAGYHHSPPPPVAPTPVTPVGQYIPHVAGAHPSYAPPAVLPSSGSSPANPVAYPSHPTGMPAPAGSPNLAQHQYAPQPYGTYPPSFPQPDQPYYPPQQYGTHPGYPPQQAYPPQGQYPHHPAAYAGFPPQHPYQQQQPAYAGYPPQPVYGYPTSTAAPPEAGVVAARSEESTFTSSAATDSLATSMAGMAIASASTAPVTIPYSSQSPHVGAPQTLPSNN
ncbi:Copine-5 [Mortierella sp. GBA30]|nr:Copine-5 [Mortierella sp. GBA30]